MTKRKTEDPYDLCTCYEPSEPTPEEFIDPGDREPTLADTAFYLTDESGVDAESGETERAFRRNGAPIPNQTA